MTYFLWYTGFAMLLTTLLAMNVSRVRMKEKIGVGDGGSKNLKIAMRAHMNSLEHTVPYGLILHALTYVDLSNTALSIFAFGFIITRCLQSYSMLASVFRLRQITAALTYLFQVVGCITILLCI